MRNRQKRGRNGWREGSQVLAVINLEKDDVSLESSGGAKVEKKEGIREQTRTERTGDWVVGLSRRMGERSCAGLAPVFFICSDGGDPAEGHEDRAGKWREDPGSAPDRLNLTWLRLIRGSTPSRQVLTPGTRPGTPGALHPSPRGTDLTERQRAPGTSPRAVFPSRVFIVVFPSLRRAPARSPPRCHVHTVRQSGDKLSSKPCR